MRSVLVALLPRRRHPRPPSDPWSPSMTTPSATTATFEAAARTSWLRCRTCTIGQDFVASRHLLANLTAVVADRAGVDVESSFVSRRLERIDDRFRMRTREGRYLDRFEARAGDLADRAPAGGRRLGRRAARRRSREGLSMLERSSGVTPVVGALRTARRTTPRSPRPGDRSVGPLPQEQRPSRARPAPRWRRARPRSQPRRN